MASRYHSTDFTVVWVGRCRLSRVRVLRRMSPSRGLELPADLGPLRGPPEPAPHDRDEVAPGILLGAALPLQPIGQVAIVAGAVRRLEQRLQFVLRVGEVVVKVRLRSPARPRSRTADTG